MKKILTLIFITLVLTGCSNEGIDKSSSSNAFSPSVTKLDLTSKLPVNLKQNSPETFAQISQMATYMNLGSMYMNNNNSASRTSGLINTWNYGGFTVAYTYSLVGSQYQFNYTITQDSKIYYTISGWENKDGSAGHWSYNINTAVLGLPNGSSYNIIFDWTKSNIGNYHFEMKCDMGSSNNLYYIANINYDYSGNYKYTLNNSPFLDASWNASGHGKLTYYYSDPPTVYTF